MAKVTPDQAAAKWAQRLSGATADIAAGIDRVSVAPGQAAARNADTWQQRTLAAKDKWTRNVARVSLGEWQDAAKSKGVPRIAAGAQAAQGKMGQFMQEFLPHVDRGAAQVRAMPNATLEQSIARATAMIRHNASFRRGGGSA